MDKKFDYLPEGSNDVSSVPYGNRNRHHDPLLTLRKLLCFGDRVWAALRGAVESVRGGGEEKGVYPSIDLKFPQE